MYEYKQSWTLYDESSYNNINDLTSMVILHA